MQKVICAAPADERGTANLFFDFINAAKIFVMISDDEIFAEIAVQFFGNEIIRIRFDSDTVKDEEKIVGKSLDFRLVARHYRVFNRQRVKVKHVGENFFVVFGRCFHINPDEISVVG